MAISNLGLAAGAAIMGQLKELFNWEYVILSYIIFVFVMLVLMKFIYFENHEKRVDELELKFNETTEQAITASSNNI